MRNFMVAGLITIFCAGLASGQAAPQTSSNQLRVSFPGEPWVLAFDAAGFKTVSNGLQPDGRVYLRAENESSQVTLSVFLEKVHGSATVDGCKDNQKVRLTQDVPYKREKIDSRETDGMEIVEYTMPEFAGAPVQQRNLFACLAKDDVYIDIHLSKILFKAEQEALFNTILASRHFVGVLTSDSGDTKPAPPTNASNTTWNLFRDGTRYFAQQNFPASIPPYQKALDAEKQLPTLEKTYWRVLVDNLGMAYGITGDLNRSEQTFNYGISQDPTYPLFYYNLACASAERKDMPKTMDYLRKAFSYKATVIEGESMPDPRKDDSFRLFMADKKFRDFVDSL